MKKRTNAISWFEIPVIDMQRAKGFYEAILDIQLMVIDLDVDFTIALFPVEEGTVGGALCKNEKFYTPAKTGNILYLNANPDLQVSLEKVEKAGGKIIKSKEHISDAFGFVAFIEDTEGNRIALHSK